MLEMLEYVLVCDLYVDPSVSEKHWHLPMSNNVKYVNWVGMCSNVLL